MGKTKVTLDTNILLSAFGWKGNPRQVFDEVIAGNVELIISDEQYSELERALNYPKFQFTEEQKSRFKMMVLEIATFVRPKEKINEIREDPDDNMILEAAAAGNANYIVSGDPHILNLKEFRNIKIVSAREFLEKIEK